MTTEDTSQMPLFSPEDEKEAQKELKRLRKTEIGVFKVNHKRTGFENKTLWDWLQLLGVLAIPLVVAGASILFGIQQANLANQQHAADQEQALDQQRADTLQKYIDNIQDLMLNHNLLKSDINDNPYKVNPYNDVATLARARTLTALQGLDPVRKGLLVQFIYEANLIGVSIDYHLPACFNGIGHVPGGEIVQIDAKIDLTGADLSSADLEGINLSGANLSNANLSSADLEGTEFWDAKLSNANLSNANLKNADLTEAHLNSGFLSVTNLKNADLSGADLECAFFESADFTSANLISANLEGADLTSAILTSANLEGATLTFADFSRADLTSANFRYALFNKTDLTSADLSRANLDSATLFHSYFNDTDLSGSHNLTQQQLDQVYTCKGAILPKGLTCHNQ